MLASVLFSDGTTGIKPNMDVPYDSEGDAIFSHFLAKRVMEGGGWDNDRCGYPFGSNLRDFPGSDAGNLFTLKILGIFTGEYYKSVNLFILLSFPSAFCAAFIVLLSIGMDKFLALSAAMLFAFLPFHFQRVAHLFYLSYFVVPIYYYYAFRIFYAENAKFKMLCFKFKSLIVFLPAAILSCFGVYYALFGMIVIAVAGLSVAFKTSNLKPLLSSMLAIGVITVGVFLNLAPSILNNIKNGKNSEVAVRSIGESEVFGFKLAQLVLPRVGHRIQKLAALTDNYIISTPLNNENVTAALGFFGSVGLLIAGCVLAANSSGRLIDSRMSLLALISLILFISGTIGGIGSLFAMAITPSIRGWNRISPFLAFSCLAIFFFFIQFYINNILKKNYWYFTIGIGILFIGIYDQTIPLLNPAIAQARKDKFEGDRSFIMQIENNIEPHSPIYQLPYMPFPENGPINKLGDYELCSGFLNSKTLRWNYAGMKGRPGDIFYKKLSSMPILEQIPIIRKLGFKGIYVDRRGFSDNAKALEEELSSILIGASKLEKIDKTAFFMPLTESDSPDFTNLTPHQILATINWGALKPGIRCSHNQTEYLTFQSWSGAEKEHRWSLGKKCSIEFLIDSTDDFQGELILNGFSYSNQKVDIILNNKLLKTCDMNGSRGITSVQFPKGLLKHGSNKLTLFIPGARKPDNGDPREVGYALCYIIIK